MKNTRPRTAGAARTAGANRGGGLTGRVTAFLQRQIQLGKVTQQVINDIANGRLELRNHEHYIAKQITTGNTEFVDSSNAKLVGLSTFDKTTLDKYFVLTGITLKHATHASETNPRAVVYENYKAMVAGIDNGEIVISLNGKPIIESPIAKFFVNSATAQPIEVGGNLDTVQLDYFRFFTPKDSIQIETKLPAGASLTNNHFLKVFLRGVEIDLR